MDLILIRFPHADGGEREVIINLDHVMSITHDYDNAHTIHYTNGETLIISNDTFNELVKRLYKGGE